MQTEVVYFHCLCRERHRRNTIWAVCFSPWLRLASVHAYWARPAWRWERGCGQEDAWPQIDTKPSGLGLNVKCFRWPADKTSSCVSETATQSCHLRWCDQRWGGVSVTSVGWWLTRPLYPSFRVFIAVLWSFASSSLVRDWDCWHFLLKRVSSVWNSLDRSYVRKFCFLLGEEKKRRRDKNKEQKQQQKTTSNNNNKNKPQNCDAYTRDPMWQCIYSVHCEIRRFSMSRNSLNFYWWERERALNDFAKLQQPSASTGWFETASLKWHLCGQGIDHHWFAMAPRFCNTNPSKWMVLAVAALALVPSVYSAEFYLEAAASNGRLRTVNRSSARSGVAVKLGAGDSIQLTFCLRQTTVLQVKTLPLFLCLIIKGRESLCCH